MDDKDSVPIIGNLATKGAPDGVSGVPHDTDGREIHGRSLGGESGGGAYPNPHSGKKPTNGGFLGHGGQTDIAYHGGGQAGEVGGNAPNAVAGSVHGERSTIAADPEADRKPREIVANGNPLKVVETSGIAQAEASGRVGTDGQNEAEQRQPGSG